MDKDVFLSAARHAGKPIAELSDCVSMLRSGIDLAQPVSVARRDFVTVTELNATR
ncbi:hypothetical protein [Rhodopseudomonas pseudopalustris]|uniref:hypothetical protein n=1 Tax=Rhodopseudomonas pseudopalustris TaxID=1513892 RepID=UPI00158808F4|nr:hypothetical protein [Rhodopseudomonas pseudopalustris]MBB1092293.1 hypothetical protein [Rhodopseudomonas palustris]